MSTFVPFPGCDIYNSPEMFGFDFDDIFDRFFGGQYSRRRGPKRGEDLRDDIEITLEEAAQGAEREIVIPRLEKCAKCSGTGAESKSEIMACDECNGSGYKGRVGIYEVIVANDAIRNAILERAGAPEIRRIAIAHGMSTMIEDGFRKVASGLTTVEEVLRVIHE